MAIGEPIEFPPDYLEIDVPDSVILDRTFVERITPEALHSEDQLGEDDGFLSVGSETWDYDVAGGRDDEFLAVVKNSQLAIECLPLAEEHNAG